MNSSIMDGPTTATSPEDFLDEMMVTSEKQGKSFKDLSRDMCSEEHFPIKLIETIDSMGDLERRHVDLVCSMLLKTGCSVY